MNSDGEALRAGRGGSGRRPGARFSPRRLLIGVFLVVAAAAGVAWAAYHPSRQWTDIVSLAAILFSFLVLFHAIAWTARDAVTMAMVRAIDYVYLLAAAAGLAMSHLRQDNAGSVTVISWSRPVVLLLIAALALRLTRTTIEVFGWHRR
jgi:hypothetical protein